MLQVTESQKQKDGVLNIVAKGEIEGQNVNLAILVPTIWKQVERTEFQPERAEFSLLFVPIDESHLVLNSLLSRCFGAHWSLFGKGGVLMLANAEQANVDAR